MRTNGFGRNFSKKAEKKRKIKWIITLTNKKKERKIRNVSQRNKKKLL